MRENTPEQFQSTKNEITKLAREIRAMGLKKDGSSETRGKLLSVKVIRALIMDLLVKNTEGAASEAGLAHKFKPGQLATVANAVEKLSEMEFSLGQQWFSNLSRGLQFCRSVHGDRMSPMQVVIMYVCQTVNMRRRWTLIGG